MTGPIRRRAVSHLGEPYRAQPVVELALPLPCLGLRSCRRPAQAR